MKKYIRLIWIEMKKVKEYSLNFVGTLFSLPIQILVIYFIWKFVFQHNNTIANYTFSEMVMYYILLRIFQNAITPVGITAYEVWVDINRGNLNLFLSRPVYYPFYVFFRKVGFFLWGVLSGFLLLLLLKVLLPIDMQFTFLQAMLSICSAFLGFVILYSLFFCVGTLTFWVENILSLRDNLWNILRVLSGQIFPIALFPGVIRHVAEILPFQYIYYVPISIVQGKIYGQGLLRMLISQCLWCIVLLLFAMLLWGQGTKQYTSQGG